ncbi:phosphate signaling complex protein PhoU [Megalodesulfovibrio paquesii]
MTAKEKPHIVRSFDEELESMNSLLVTMGEKALLQLEKAIAALRARDVELANTVLRGDDLVDSMHAQVNTLTIGLLATRQPVATDLRHVVASLKMATDLERVADYAASVAGCALALPAAPSGHVMEKIEQLAQVVEKLLTDAVAALSQESEEAAVAVWHADDAVDAAYLALMQTLHEDIAAHPESLAVNSQLLFVARSLERLADHVTNVAGHLIYSITGKIYKGEN